MDMLVTLRYRFGEKKGKLKNVQWEKISERLEKNNQVLEVLSRMEETGGEPDVLDYDEQADEYIFCDFSPESPKGRRSLCYDGEALFLRKRNKPCGSALEMAKEIGIEIMTAEEYRRLQEFGEYDMKTSSWIRTPDDIRRLGGALFCDRRYNHVFTYHNGAASYYESRGFRGSVRL